MCLLIFLRRIGGGGEKIKIWGNYPQRWKVSQPFGDGLASYLCVFFKKKKKCASLPCFPISSFSTLLLSMEFQLGSAGAPPPPRLTGSSPICRGFLSHGLAGRWKNGQGTLMQPLRPGEGKELPGPLGRQRPVPSFQTCRRPPSHLALDPVPRPFLRHHRCVNLGASWILP